jgi:hypothetical protein
MFTGNAMLALLDARPFAPFRLHTSDGFYVDVLSKELVIPGRNFAVVGILEQGLSDRLANRWVTVWYMHVTRTEMPNPGEPPFASTPPASEQPTPV